MPTSDVIMCSMPHAQMSSIDFLMPSLLLIVLAPRPSRLFLLLVNLSSVLIRAKADGKGFLGTVMRLITICSSSFGSSSQSSPPGKGGRTRVGSRSVAPLAIIFGRDEIDDVDTDDGDRARRFREPRRLCFVGVEASSS